MADVNEEELNAASQATYGLDYPGGLRAATGLNLDPEGICKTLFGLSLNQCENQLLALVSSHALLLDGASGSYASTADVAALDIVSDIDLRIEFLAFATNTPPVALVGKYTETADQRSYLFQLGAFGLPDLVWSSAGTSGTVLNSLAIPPAGTDIRALRATLDVDNGAAGNTSVHFAGPSLGAGTQYDDEVKGGVTSIFSSSAPLTLGAINAGTGRRLIGRITRMELRAGIGGSVVANPDFRNLAPGTTSFADGTGKTWTVHGTARVV